jgi:hypothetical protein
MCILRDAIGSIYFSGGDDPFPSWLTLRKRAERAVALLPRNMQPNQWNC